MVARGRGGSVVTMTTVEAFRAIPGHAVYSGAKAALEAWSRSMALEHGRDGIRFNTIAPDLIDTPQVPYRQLVAEEDWWRWQLWAPLARPGLPEDVAGAALFLASPLSRFMTGTVLHVDGGSHAAGGWFPKESGGWTNRPRNP
jgi:NAD(P)-dependent dehydrogenase (short-subunit alcohol dehydrogenase family)